MRAVSASPDKAAAIATRSSLSMSLKGNDVASLMETVASRLRELGDVDVLDLTFSRSFEDDSENPTISVYFNFLGPAPDSVIL